MPNKFSASNYFLFLYVFIFTLFVFPNEIKAATGSLYLAPSSGTYTVGNTFSVQVKTNSGGIAVNAADGTLVFNPDKLEVKTVSKDGSIFTLWVQEPSFSNSLGTISFAGGMPTPGFTGASGTIITVVFKIKTSSDAANITFASGSILADDGKGTNILSSFGSGVYKLEGREITPIPPISPVPVVLPLAKPGAPVVVCPGKEQKNICYTNNQNLQLSWEVPQDILKVSYSLDESSTTNPEFVANVLAKDVLYSVLSPGIYYFHINFKNQFGWGELTHKKIIIDTTPPLIFEIEIQTESPTDSRPDLFFSKIDESSDIDHYEIKIRTEDVLIISPEEIMGGIYEMPQMAAGVYELTIKAFDKAGNSTAIQTKIEILPTEKEKELSPVLKFGTTAVSYLVTFGFLIFIFALIAGIIFFTWYRISVLRKKINKETKETSRSLTGAFKGLRNELEKEISLLDGKPGLNKEEKEIRDKLREILEDYEEYMGKKIKDIGK